MKNPFISLVFSALLPILLSCVLAVAEDTPQLLQIKHATLSPASEQVVLQLNGSYSPKIFTLKDEKPRVVFDFANMTQGKGVKNITTTDGSIVKRIRVGAHGDEAPKTRVVFDLATLKGVTYTHHYDEQNASLVIRFTGPEKAAAPPKPEKTPEPAAQKAIKPGKESAKPPEAAKPADTAAQATPTSPAPPVEQPAAATLPTTQAPPPVVEPEAAPKTVPVKPEEQAPVAASKDKTAPPVEGKKVEQPAAPPAESKKAEQPAPASPTKPEMVAAGKEEKPTEAKKTAEPPAEAKKEAPSTPETVSKQTAQPQAAAPPAPAAKAEGEQPAAKEKASPGKTDVALKTADNPLLESVRFDPSSPKGEMVLFKLNGFHPPAVHGVEQGIPRVICDFNNTKLADGTKSLIKPDGKFVKVIRTTKTKKPEKVRVVIDLEPNRSYDLQQVFFKDDNLFVLIVNTVKK